MPAGGARTPSSSSWHDASLPAVAGPGLASRIRTPAFYLCIPLPITPCLRPALGGASNARPESHGGASRSGPRSLRMEQHHSRRNAVLAPELRPSPRRASGVPRRRLVAFCHSVRPRTCTIISYVCAHFVRRRSTVVPEDGRRVGRRRRCPEETSAGLAGVSQGLRSSLSALETGQCEKG